MSEATGLGEHGVAFPSRRCFEDGEKTLTQEDNYSKVFLMKMPIMVRPVGREPQSGSSSLLSLGIKRTIPNVE